jgi:hypothetical protein
MKLPGELIVGAPKVVPSFSHISLGSHSQLVAIEARFLDQNAWLDLSRRLGLDMTTSLEGTGSDNPFTLERALAPPEDPC